MPATATTMEEAEAGVSSDTKPPTMESIDKSGVSVGDGEDIEADSQSEDSVAGDDGCDSDDEDSSGSSEEDDGDSSSGEERDEGEEVSAVSFESTQVAK